MSPDQGRIVYDHVRNAKPDAVLELGTAHGVGAAYLAGALADNAHGHLTTVDFAGAAYDPSPEAVLARAGVAQRVTVVREFSSYTWWLKEQVQARSDGAGNVEPAYDFVYLDGAKNWTIDGLAVVLVEKLLRPGGWLLMDDLPWTYAQHPGREATDGVVHRELSEPERTRAAPARGLRPDRRPAPVVHGAEDPGRVVGLGPQVARRAAADDAGDEPAARRAGGRRGAQGRPAGASGDEEAVAEVQLVALEQVGVALRPRAAAQVLLQPRQAGRQLLLGALRHRRDAGAHVGVEVGVRAAPVGAVEAVLAVVRDRDAPSRGSRGRPPPGRRATGSRPRRRARARGSSPR